MLAPWRRVVAAALVVVLLSGVIAGLPRSGAAPATVESGHAAITPIGASVAGAACPLVCDADGDGLLDALLLPCLAGVIAGLALLLRCSQPWPRALAGRSIPPLPPPPRSFR
ncbi:MAG TPA: hypothetical protein VFD32_19985 [Dehalococcoidia bacterium]|nr:hypothetical protein [Dehalococcoidia bacterium]